MVFRLKEHPIHERMKGSEFFFHVVPIFTELGQGLSHFAHKENTQSDIFLWDIGTKIFNCIVFSWSSDIISFLPWLKY